MQRFLLACSFALVACGGSVASETKEAEPPVKTPDPTPEWAETASCDVIASTCGGDPALLVRGHASGLVDLEGARVEFAIRYVHRDDEGLDVPHGVALGRTHVSGGSFLTCICVPEGANGYPQVAAVVYRPGATKLTGADAARAMFSQRYATLGDEDVSYALNAVPNDAQKEAAVAAMVARTATTTLELPSPEAAMVYAGLVADERPIAAQYTNGKLGAALTWIMPGRAFASERVAFFVDRNNNGKCDTDGGDVGGFAPFASTIKFSDKLLTGTELGAVCGALQTEVSRE